MRYHLFLKSFVMMVKKAKESEILLYDFNPTPLCKLGVPLYVWSLKLRFNCTYLYSFQTKSKLKWLFRFSDNKIFLDCSGNFGVSEVCVYVSAGNAREVNS